jgi:rRNA-processing protein FCF1
MCAAGTTEHPVSLACRKALSTILKICHRVLVSESIETEWDQHTSKFARKWKIAMMNKRKTYKANHSLAPILLKGVSTNDRTIIEKDRHLLDAAYTHDKIIITTDDKVQKALKRTGNQKMLREILWLNPCHQEIDSLNNL